MFFKNVNCYTVLKTAAFQVVIWEAVGSRSSGLRQTWKLIPVDVQDTPTPSQPPSETLAPDPPPPSSEGQSSAPAQGNEPEGEEFVEEVTVVTTTTTTRRKLRSGNA